MNLLKPGMNVSGFLFLGFLDTMEFFVVMLCINILPYLCFIIFLYFWVLVTYKNKKHDAKR